MVFDFTDYRGYLKFYIRSLPKKGFGEARKIAAHLGVSSTFLSHVLAGKKDFSAEQASLLSEYLGLSDLESEFFFYLVQHERAGTTKLKKFCERKLKELKDTSLKLSKRVNFNKTLTDEQKSIFYSSALYSAVHLFTSVKAKGVTTEDIIARFEVSRARAQEVIRFLLEAGLIVEDKSNYQMGAQSTHVDSGSPHLLKHHANWRIKAIQASETLAENELMYTVNVSLSKEDFEKLREEMVQYIKKFLEKIYPSPSEEIACFNLDWFWIRK